MYLEYLGHPSTIIPVHEGSDTQIPHSYRGGKGLVCTIRSQPLQRNSLGTIFCIFRVETMMRWLCCCGPGKKGWKFVSSTQRRAQLKTQVPVSPCSGSRFFCTLKTSTSEPPNKYRMKLKQLESAAPIFINIFEDITTIITQREIGPTEKDQPHACWQLTVIGQEDSGWLTLRQC